MNPPICAVFETVPTAPNYTITAPGTVSKTAQIGGFTYYPAWILGAVRLRPGQGIRWTTMPGTGNNSTAYSAAIYLEGWKRPAEA